MTYFVNKWSATEDLPTDLLLRDIRSNIIANIHKTIDGIWICNSIKDNGWSWTRIGVVFTEESAKNLSVEYLKSIGYTLISEYSAEKLSNFT